MEPPIWDVVVKMHILAAAGSGHHGIDGGWRWGTVIGRRTGLHRGFPGDGLVDLGISGIQAVTAEPPNLDRAIAGIWVITV
jgi:hypothetical protein